jgi:hypothetical protein
MNIYHTGKMCRDYRGHWGKEKKYPSSRRRPGSSGFKQNAFFVLLDPGLRRDDGSHELSTDQ